jgi:hypothetical protein
MPRRTSRAWAAGEQMLKHAPRHPDQTVVFADLDTELDGLPLCIPTGVFGKGEEHGRFRSPSGLDKCSLYVRELACNSVASCPDCFLWLMGSPDRALRRELINWRRWGAALFLVLALSGCAQEKAGQTGAPYAPHPSSTAEGTAAVAVGHVAGEAAVDPHPSLPAISTLGLMRIAR